MVTFTHRASQSCSQQHNDQRDDKSEYTGFGESGRIDIEVELGGDVEFAAQDPTGCAEYGPDDDRPDYDSEPVLGSIKASHTSGSVSADDVGNEQTNQGGNGRPNPNILRGGR